MPGYRPQLVTIDPYAEAHLVAFCRDQGFTRLLLVADRNTYAVQGEAVAEALRTAGFDLKQVVFPGPEVVADAQHVLDVLVEAGREERIYIAVGTGTLTDITRFASHRTKTRFIAMPTAPSVDGFASLGAPLIVHGIKVTLITHAPLAIIADSETLAQAPRAMIAAGFADVLGKLTSVADFKLGKLLWDEPYDEEIARRTRATAQVCIDNAAAIGAGSEAAVKVLMEALLDSGYCMLDFGNSRPASGTEHHYSHFWELMLLKQGRPAILHGAKVGVATRLVAAWYAQVRSISRAQAEDLLEDSTLPPRAEELARIRAAYGEQVGEIARDQAEFLELDEAGYDALKRRILDNWEAVQAIAAEVPAPEAIAGWLREVGGPVTVEELGLSVDEGKLAADYGHYLRNRFTVRKLARMLGID